MYTQQCNDFPEFMKENSQCLLGLRMRVITPDVFAAALGGG